MWAEVSFADEGKEAVHVEVGVYDTGKLAGTLLEDRDSDANMIRNY